MPAWLVNGLQPYSLLVMSPLDGLSMVATTEAARPATFPPHLHFQLALLALIQSSNKVKELPLFVASEGEAERVQGIKLLQELIGEGVHYYFLPSWNHRRGPLAQLLYYLSLELDRCCQKHLHQLLYQQRLGVEAWLDEARQRLDQLTKNKGHAELRMPLLKQLSPLQEGFLQWGRHFRGNENVLFFALMRAEPLYKAFGKDFLKLLFANLFADQTSSLADYLKSRYSARQFQRLIPTIDGQIALLQKWMC